MNGDEKSVFLEEALKLPRLLCWPIWSAADLPTKLKDIFKKNPQNLKFPIFYQWRSTSYLLLTLNQVENLDQLTSNIPVLVPEKFYNDLQSLISSRNLSDTVLQPKSQEAPQAVLNIEIENDLLKVKNSDGTNLNLQKNLSQLDLTQPSIFRIVMQSKKKFLGQPAPLKIHEEFFKAWGYSQFPSNIIVEPVIENESVKALRIEVLAA